MKTILPVLALLSSIALLAYAEAPTADQVLASAKAKAAAEHKAIFLHFGASWCGWCKRLDAFLDRPDIKPVFDKYFIPVKLVVQENDKNKALENPGADALLKDFGGPAGLPYSAFLDAKGALIVNSKLNGQNIGYPGEPERDRLVHPDDEEGRAQHVPGRPEDDRNGAQEFQEGRDAQLAKSWPTKLPRWRCKAFTSARPHGNTRAGAGCSMTAPATNTGASLPKPGSSGTAWRNTRRSSRRSASMPPTTRSPASSTWRAWSNQTPDDFLFGLKVTDAITIKKFPKLDRFGEQAGKPNENFLNADLFVKAFLKPCEAVRSNIGLLMFEFSRFWPTDYEHGRDFIADLDKFLGQLPERLAIRGGNEEPGLAQAGILRVPRPAPGRACVQ